MNFGALKETFNIIVKGKCLIMISEFSWVADSCHSFKLFILHLSYFSGATKTAIIEYRWTIILTPWEIISTWEFNENEQLLAYELPNPDFIFYYLSSRLEWTVCVIPLQINFVTFCFFFNVPTFIMRFTSMYLSLFTDMFNMVLSLIWTCE